MKRAFFGLFVVILSVSCVADVGAPPPPPDRKDYSFRQELAERTPYRTHWSRTAKRGECDLSRGIRVRDDYGLNGNLTTVRDDLKNFLADVGLAKAKGKTLRLVKAHLSGYESHRIRVTANGVELAAEDNEGMRRAVCTFERALLSSPAPALPLGERVRKPWLETRLSRCFFGPINRPPLNHDELMDDIDYYPEPYLNRLAHEGVNGLWIVVRFEDLAETSFTQRAPTAPQRLAKLRKTVEKLARYGIKLWLFAIEPRRINLNSPLAKEHPEFVGKKIMDPECIFCTGTDNAKRYLEEAMRDVYRQVPGLGGYIGITHGERPTSCLSELSPELSHGKIGCSICGKLPNWRIHADTVSAMARGMRQAEPSARFFSWFYHPQSTVYRNPFVYDCAAHVPEGVGIVYNFESGVVVEQEGKPHVGGDYWLAAVGPGEPFKKVAAAVRGTGTPLMAKLQVSCAYDMATVPFVPAPGILHRKYRAMQKLGCTDVMQCWYIGSAPGVMTEAAGELAFDGCDMDEATFVETLARPRWGRDAPAVARLYSGFSEGYLNYPISNYMQYFGPFSEGIARPLAADLDLRMLSPTYKSDWPVAGDTIGDSLGDYTLAEVCILAERMLSAMNVRAADGTDLLEDLLTENAGDRERRRELGVMKAVRLLVESSLDTFRFYRARRTAVSASRDFHDGTRASSEVAVMRQIVENEKRLVREMLPLAQEDSLLGYHGDAEVHRFHPALLEWRLKSLDETARRLDEIGKVVGRGEAYPMSAAEKGAVTFPGRRRADGGIVLEGSVNGCLNRVKVVLYDRCGSEFAKELETPVRNGQFRLELSPDFWHADESLIPGWIMVHDGGFVRRFPDIPLAPSRLLLWHTAVCGCARIDYGKAASPSNTKENENR